MNALKNGNVSNYFYKSTKCIDEQKKSFNKTKPQMLCGCKLKIILRHVKDCSPSAENVWPNYEPT